ncbi:stomatin-like protein 1 [Babylonia areolata]|uniref:stomatin-like protein 1 n=1 Tax=Babylonia areolata TaxID=304850 RepID=UPI003FD1D477
MSARYSRLPTEDTMESGFGFGSTGGSTFDYSSVFTFSNGSSRNYKSAFTYSTDSKIQLESDVQFESDSRSLMDKVCYVILNALVFLLFLVTFPISVWFAIKMVPQHERLVVFRWGQLYKVKGPGMVFVMPFVDRCHKVDVRLKAFTVPPQQVITSDRAIIELGADVYYRIVRPELTITSVQNLDQSTRELLNNSLHNTLVAQPLARIEGQRNAIAQEVQDKCNKMADAWGIEICRLDISQIKVLQKPPTNQPKPTFVMPPGLASLGGSIGAAVQSLTGGDVPEAFEQLATAFLTSQGLPLPKEPQAPHIPVTLVTPASETYDNTTTTTSEPSSMASSLFSSPPTTPAPPTPHNSSTTTLSSTRLSIPGGSSAGGDVGGAKPSTMPASMLCVKDLVQATQCVLSESLVRKVDAVYNFQLRGEGGGLYYVDLKHGSGSVGEGVYPGHKADVTLIMSVVDLDRMMRGKLKPFQAYMTGRLRVSGDLDTALKLENVVDKVVAQYKGR